MKKQTIQIDGKTYKLVLVEPEQELKAYERPNTFRQAFEKVEDKLYFYSIGSAYSSKKDADSAFAYRKLKIIEAALNGDVKELPYCMFLSGGGLQVSVSKDIFNFKDDDTAVYFIETFKDLLKQFYQI